MSPKNRFQKIRLAALGWLGLAAADPGLAQAPPAPGQPAAPAALASAAPSPAPTVLSLYDGKVYQGKIQVDDTGYSVFQRGGVLRFRKELVEGAFGSIAEVYRFKAERLPARDPDERLKLARWCLSHRLNAEAKAQLLSVLELSPGNLEIKNMIVNIDNAESRVALRDEALVRTRAELPADGRPGELDPRVLGVVPRLDRAAATGLPRVFDLPVPLAVKRANEFARVVHPILQRACARCHNENYPGEFQLIQVKTRHDWTANVAQANLEASLRFVDPDSAARSELLTRALVPHGPHKRPIFRGATDPEYQRVAAWVKSLQRTPSEATAAPGRFGGTEPAVSASASSAAADSGLFAAERARPASLPASSPPAEPIDTRPRPPTPMNPVTPLPPGQFVAGSGSGTQPYAPPDAEFPVPYMMGGPKPRLPATPTPNPGQAAAQPPAAAGIDLPPLPTASAGPAASGAAPAGANGPGAAASAPAATASAPAATVANPPAGAASGAAAKPPRKPLQLDPALLERALTNRYTTPQ